ncbi:MAG TPA: DUF1343 domain-containing protein [Parachlamydiaceae bacterium]|nr:DUF1343 domain-containing protein [Parachlamydiaceae bacterium]
MLKTFLLIFTAFLLQITCLHSDQAPKVKVGVDRLMLDEYAKLLKGKRIGLITNQTAMSNEFKSTANVLKTNASLKGYKLVALFAPEHGINGTTSAAHSVDDSKDADQLPIYSLHGKTQRPTDQMLKDITLLIFDIQDIGSRSYTYINTMFYAMEEAAKRGIAFMVLDRPNPINGITVDGPLLEDKWRSFLGYIDIPYCHGMTAGELARYFNSEYKIGCKLDVIPMQGWKRQMTFQETGLQWIPTSPYIPESNTPFFYPTTGIIGELKLVNIGIGYTLPFKVIGAPWIKGMHFAKELNAQKFPGVHFEPFHYRPTYGRFAKEECQGVLIQITDPLVYKPVSTQYLLLGMLKGLYPDKFQESLEAIKKNKATLCKLNGCEEIFRVIVEEKNIVWKLRTLQNSGRDAFLKKRQKYLISEYGRE